MFVLEETYPLKFSFQTTFQTAATIPLSCALCIHLILRSNTVFQLEKLYSHTPISIHNKLPTQLPAGWESLGLPESVMVTAFQICVQISFWGYSSGYLLGLWGPHITSCWSGDEKRSTMAPQIVVVTDLHGQGVVWQFWLVFSPTHT